MMSYKVVVQMVGVDGCCNDFNVFECTVDLRCDNLFYYCLRTLGSTAGGVCDDGQHSIYLCTSAHRNSGQ